MRLYLTVSNTDELEAVLKVGHKHIMFSFARFSYIRFNPRGINASLFCDSGAYYMINNSERDQEYLKRYMIFILKYYDCIDYFAMLDYPEDLERTFDMALEFVEFFEQQFGSRDKLVVVITGKTLSDYLQLYGFYKDHDLLTPLVGIGALKKKDKKVAVTIARILSRKARTHVFGADMRILPYILQYAYSADTHTWAKSIAHGCVLTLSPRGGLSPKTATELNLNLRRRKDRLKALVLSARAYIQRYGQLLDKSINNTSLLQWVV